MKSITKLSSLLMLASTCALAQLPTYQLKITNEDLTAPNIFEFEVFLLSTGSMLELAALNFGIGIDTTVKDGGTLTATLLSGTSELPLAQTPIAVAMSAISSTSTTAHCGSCNGTGIIYNYMNVAPQGVPMAGHGAIIDSINGGCVHPGTRIGRFRITNTGNFKPGSRPNMVWSASPYFGRTNTVVCAFIGTTATPITFNANHVNWNSQGSCAINPVLNPLITSVSTEDATTAIQMYPNPAFNSITIQLPPASTYNELQIVDMKGRLIMDKQIAADKLFQLDVSLLNPGLYLVRLSGLSGSVYKKITIVR